MERCNASVNRRGEEQSFWYLFHLISIFFWQKGAYVGTVHLSTVGASELRQNSKNRKSKIKIYDGCLGFESCYLRVPRESFCFKCMNVGVSRGRGWRKDGIPVVAARGRPLRRNRPLRGVRKKPKMIPLDTKARTRIKMIELSIDCRNFFVQTPRSWSEGLAPKLYTSLPSLLSTGATNRTRTGPDI